MDIKKQINEVTVKYPTLSYNIERNEISGDLFLSSSDVYEINIVLSPYPKAFPHIYETGERIPKKVDRHIYTDSGSCCLTTGAKAQILLQTKVFSLLVFVRDIVIPYFQNNSFFELNRFYKSDTYSHGSKGVIEGYHDILQINNDFQIGQIIYKRLQGETYKIHHLCYCGSGVKLKKCSNGIHNKSYGDFKKIDKTLLYNDLKKNLNPHLNFLNLMQNNFNKGLQGLRR